MSDSGESSETLVRLRDLARERFGLERADELDSVLIQVADDLNAMAEFDLDPDDGS